jgi:hypothetical protein
LEDEEEGEGEGEGCLGVVLGLELALVGVMGCV